MTDTTSGAESPTSELPQIHDYAPAGYHTVTPYLAVRNGAQALDFYERAFGARVLTRMDGPQGEDGMVYHAELLIGDSVIQVSNAFAELGFAAPAETRTGSFNLYVPHADAAYARALEAGATAVSPVEDAFSGDRMGVVLCPSGHRWVLLTRVEHLSYAEIERRATASMAPAAPEEHAGETG